MWRWPEVVWQIRPARAADVETVADDLASIVWEIRRRLANTEYMFLVDQVLEELGVDPEEWRPVPWRAGYEVSSHGRVRSVDRVQARLFDGQLVRYRGKILKQQRSSFGHFSVTLGNLGVGMNEHRRAVHRLVMEVFVGPCPDGMEVRHLNGVPGDNRVENLKYGTHTENVLDAVAHGTHTFASRTACPRGHKLAEPNLIPSQLIRGHRVCLACSRGRSKWGTRKNGRPPEAQWQALADAYYRNIMSEESA
jgi:HNH endonuclease/NUMOD4 motif